MSVNIFGEDLQLHKIAGNGGGSSQQIEIKLSELEELLNQNAALIEQNSQLIQQVQEQATQNKQKLEGIEDGAQVNPGNMQGATASENGTAGLAPAPSAGNANRYLRSDGTWQVPPDTNTTYGNATTSTAGLAKISESTAVTDINSGLVLGAKEKNASINGTIMNEVEKVRSLIPSMTAITFLGFVNDYESSLDAIAENSNTSEGDVYMFTMIPKSSGGEYIMGGLTYFVIGMQYAGYKYGFQCAIGPIGIKIRGITGGSWGAWKTVQAS